jgi:phage gpG-like protein
VKTITLKELEPTIRNILRNSIERNFEVGGRYGNSLLGGGKKKWKASKRAIKQSGQTLLDSGQLAASIRVAVNSNVNITVDDDMNFKSTGDINIEIGSNKRYAAAQHFGATIKHPGGTPYLPYLIAQRKVEDSNGMPLFISLKKAKELEAKGKTVRYTKPHDIKLPARPFLVVQEEDIEDIRQRLHKFIVNRMNN